METFAEAWVAASTGEQDLAPGRAASFPGASCATIGMRFVIPFSSSAFSPPTHTSARKAIVERKARKSLSLLLLLLSPVPVVLVVMLVHLKAQPQHSDSANPSRSHYLVRHLRDAQQFGPVAQGNARNGWKINFLRSTEDDTTTPSALAGRIPTVPSHSIKQGINFDL
uniref:Uncharacterized protein n=1 Tax=Anopheles farauti TaxID=69004 RepID=A0A182QF09_9DIPT